MSHSRSIVLGWSASVCRLGCRRRSVRGFQNERYTEHKTGANRSAVLGGRHILSGASAGEPQCAVIQARDTRGFGDRRLRCQRSVSAYAGTHVHIARLADSLRRGWVEVRCARKIASRLRALPHDLLGWDRLRGGACSKRQQGYRRNPRHHEPHRTGPRAEEEYSAHSSSRLVHAEYLVCWVLRWS